MLPLIDIFNKYRKREISCTSCYIILYSIIEYLLLRVYYGKEIIYFRTRVGNTILLLRGGNADLEGSRFVAKYITEVITEIIEGFPFSLFSCYFFVTRCFSSVIGICPVIHNYLRRRCTRRRFHEHPIGKSSTIVKDLTSNSRIKWKTVELQGRNIPGIV